MNETKIVVERHHLRVIELLLANRMLFRLDLLK